jgi:hypothetical protein
LAICKRNLYKACFNPLHIAARAKLVGKSCFAGDRELRGGPGGFSETGRGHGLAASDPGIDFAGDDAVFAGCVDAQIALVPNELHGNWKR